METLNSGIYSTTIVQKLKLVESFSQLLPTTMTGKALHEKYSKIINEHGAYATFFHNFMIESLSCGDKVLENWSQTQSIRISESNHNAWKFNVLFESMANSTNKYESAAVDRIKYLTAYSESDLCEAIANGVLESTMAVTQNFNSLYESISGIKKAIKLHESNIMYTPISYIESKNGNKFLMIEGVVYEDSAEGLAVSQSPSQTFTSVNNAIQTIPYSADDQEFDCTFMVAPVNVNTRGAIYVNKKEYTLDELQAMIEDSIKDKSDVVKIQESQKFDMIKLLVENFDSIYELDNVKVVKNNINNTCSYIYEHCNMNYVLNRNGIVLQSKSLNESLDNLNKSMGVNLNPLFENKLMLEKKSLNESKSHNDSIDVEIQKYSDLVQELNEELAFIPEDSDKYQEVNGIKTDAVEIIEILKQSKI